jgi:alpha-beta hydrolase superfamily lysophospholipase
MNDGIASPPADPPVYTSLWGRWRKARRGALIAISVAFVGINAVAFMQARAMTHFVDRGDRTPPPEELNLAQKVKVLLTGVEVPRPYDTWTPTDVGLEYETVRFGGSTGQGLEAWSIAAQNPKGICIAFNPYASSKSALLHPAQVFHSLGYNLLLVDFRGSGGSVGDRTSVGFFEAEDVRAAVNYAAERWPGESVVLYGPSMGGAAVLRAVADLGVRPRCVIVESVFDRLLSTVEDRFDAMGVPSFPAARLLVFWGGLQNGYNAFDLNPADYATRVNCPVLVLQGGLDPRVTNAQAQNLYDHLAGPKEFEIFPTCGHCQMLSGDRKRWIALVTQFLRKS